MENNTDMQKDGASCSILTEMTADSVTNSTLVHLLVTVQTNNIMLCINHAVLEIIGKVLKIK